MSITLTTINSGYNLSAINDNFVKLQDALNDNIVWRTGSVSGEALMNRDLDMDGHSILNANLVIDNYSDTHAVRVPLTEDSISELPDAATRAGRLLSFDATGNPVVSVPAAGSATEVLVDLASTDDGYGSALVAFVQGGTSPSLTTTVEDQLRKVVYVTDYGTDVNGGTVDASTAIQNANDYAASIGAELHFPKGTYLLNSYVEWKTGSNWKGHGQAEIYLDVGMTLGTSFGGSARAIYGSSVSDVSVDGITFSSSKTGVTQPITTAFLESERISFSNCKFQNFGSSTYYSQGQVSFETDRISYTNCHFLNCSGDGAAISNNCTNASIIDCTFEGNGDWGLAIVEGSNNALVQGCKFIDNTSTATGVDRCSHAHFIGNTILNCEHGIRIAEFAVSTDKNQYITIVGNTIVNTGNAGISIENMATTYGMFAVSGNVIEGSSTQGIQVINSRMGTITGNTIYSVSNAGILLQNDDSTRTTGMVTVSNNVINTAVYGIQEVNSAGTMASNSISNNLIISASTSNYSLLGNSQVLDMSSTTYASTSLPFNFPSGISTTTASSGGVTPPSQVQGYLPVYVGGLLRKLPYYNA